MSTPAIQKNFDLPTVALVGRVNVGKSTLFNRLIEQKKALVSPIPGTTRTSNEGVVLWRGKEFKLIDTGGLTFSDQILLEKKIIEQTERAVSQTDVVVFVTDAQQTILPQEKMLLRRLRGKYPTKKIVLVANKADNEKIEGELDRVEWSRMSLGEPFLLSAANGRRIGDFLDFLFGALKKIKKQPKKYHDRTETVINISIIGKPNVGKSSIFNKLIGEEKVIVSPIAHTTREPHDTLVSYENQLINFIDTAGIRRKAAVQGGLEEAGIQKSLRAIEQSDLVLFVIDAEEAISSQDRQLGGLLERKSKSVIILVNKWDLTEDNSDRGRNEVKKMVYAHFPHLDFAPIIFISGLTGYRVQQIFPVITATWKARHTEISDELLSDFLKEAKKRRLPTRDKGTRHPELLGLRQINAAPPIFELFIKPKTSVHLSYVSYLENKLREQFDFLGTPIVIKLTKLKK